MIVLDASALVELLLGTEQGRSIAGRIADPTRFGPGRRPARRRLPTRRRSLARHGLAGLRVASATRLVV